VHQGLGEAFVENRDVESARDYHESTKLAYINLRNKPPIYKSYTGLPFVPLPTGFDPPGCSTLEAVAGAGSRDGTRSLDLDFLAQLLHFSAGLVRKQVLPVAGDVHYRAAASAGALFPVEVYLVTGDIPDLKAGVYHFSPSGPALTQLREGDYRRELVEATAEDPRIAAAPVTLVLSAIFWRSSWKYRARGYRYCYWDAGTILANALAVARGGADFPISLVAGFEDQRVNRLLDISPDREASLCLVPIGTDDRAQTAAPPLDAAPLNVQVTDGLDSEISYPEIIRTHANSCLTTKEEVLAWRSNGRSDASSDPPYAGIPLGQGIGPRLDVEDLKAAPLSATILQRGSTRRFGRESISSSQFGIILDASTRNLPADFLGKEAGSLLEAYIIVNAVQGLTPGAYFFSPMERRLALLKQGDFREEAGHLCFEQALGADASVVVYFMVPLDQVLERYGNRGYRASQLEAGIRVGNAYLCSHSLGLGATGMTFYDDEVTEFFSPHAEGKSVMFLVAVGVTHEKNRVRPFRSRVGVLLDSLARGAGSHPPAISE
jgi:SagB-type dehydrogenase family enzyme